MKILHREKPKILIVDDEQETRSHLDQFLHQRINCEIIQAANGYEAIEKLKNNSIDLILLDIKMPGISGTEVLQKAYGISKSISIIVLTKWDSPEMSERVKQLGAEYIPKPFSLKIIQSKVEEKLKAMNKFMANEEP